MPEQLSLSAYLERHYLPARIALSEEYTTQLRRLVRDFGDRILSDLTEQHIAEYLSIRAQSKSASTVNRDGRYLRMLWMCAYDEGLVERPPRRIRRLPERVPTPTAWTSEEVGRLLLEAGTLDGYICCVPASLWWGSLFATTYWTGCRIGALRTARKADWDSPRSALLIRNQKNGHEQLYILPGSCAKRLDELAVFCKREDGLLWPWPYAKQTLFTRARRIIEASGIRCPKSRLQLFHRLRRTNLSYCAKADPVVAQRQADHASYETTRRHYIDPTICGGRSAADVLPEPVCATRLTVIG